MIYNIKINPEELKSMIMSYCMENLKFEKVFPADIDISFICEPEMYGRGMGEHTAYTFKGVNIKIDKQL